MADADPFAADPAVVAGSLTGACFCDAVELRVTGAPVETGYCHCASCRAWSGAPFVTYALFAAGQVAVAQGTDLLGLVNRTGMSARRFCTRCGDHVMTGHPA